MELAYVHGRCACFVMTNRVHVLLDDAEKARYRAQAAREGKSLGAWLRAAAEDRLRAAAMHPDLRSRGSLERFFAECDVREIGEEPGWEEQRTLIERSRTSRLDVT
jgi:hypothetical protein